MTNKTTLMATALIAAVLGTVAWKSWLPMHSLSFDFASSPANKSLAAASPEQAAPNMAQAETPGTPMSTTAAANYPANSIVQDLVQQQAANREKQRTDLEQALAQVKSEIAAGPDSNASADQKAAFEKRTMDEQLSLQTQLADLLKPPPTPVDLGEVKLVEGIPFNFTMPSGENANLTVVSETNGSLNIAAQLKYAHADDSNNVGFVVMQAATPGQPVVFQKNDYYIRVTPAQ